MALIDAALRQRADEATRAERERCEAAIRDCASLDTDGHIIERKDAIAAIRARITPIPGAAGAAMQDLSDKMQRRKPED